MAVLAVGVAAVAVILSVAFWRRFFTHGGKSSSRERVEPTRGEIHQNWPAELLPQLDNGGFRWMTNRRGLQIATYRFATAEKPIATCVLVHGYRISGRFEYCRPPAVGDAHTILDGSTLGSLLAAGCECVMLDVQGHGLSEGHGSGSCRAYFESFEEVVDDLLQLIDERRLLAASRRARLPLFLVGCSMGGAIVTRAAQRLPPGSVSGLVCISPLITIARKVPSPLVGLSVALVRLASLLMPSQPTGITNKKNPYPWGEANYVRETQTDPTIYQGSVRCRMMYEFLQITLAFVERASYAALETVRAESLLVIASRTDRIVDSTGSEANRGSSGGDAGVPTVSRTGSSSGKEEAFASK